ncbi:hypothetical protein [Sandaracinus amylolyticus]|nr:hypothetical protein [Sandaracinus amylolyticus]
MRNGWWSRAGTLCSAMVLSGVLVALTGCGGGGGDSALPGVQALVFVQRAYERDDLSHDVASGSGQVIDYQRYTPGGAVMVLEPPTPDGTLRNLTEGFEGVDVNGLDLSFDARRVVFSMRHADDDHYHVYVTNVDGTGEVRQLTFGDWDDIRPIFVPGDRIAFVTNEPYTVMGTRADEYNHGRAVTQIATVSIDGGDADRRLCAHNLSHSADPFLVTDGENAGQIGFSRWEHLGPVNDVKLFRMNPDCSGMEAIAGQFNRGAGDNADFNSLVQATEIAPGQYLAIGTSRSRTIQSGAVIRIDARAREGRDPLRIDVQQATFENLTPLVPTESESPPSGVGRYRHPRAIAGFEGQVLVSWSDGDVNDRNELAGTAPQFGIYLYDVESGRRTLVYDDPELWDVYAMPVMPREEPAVIPSTVSGAFEPARPAVIGSIDVAETSLGETVRGAQFGEGVSLHDALLEATHVRIIEGFSSEIGAVGQFGLTMHEGAAILGETPVYEDGSWSAQVPAYLPYHLQPIDRFGLAIRNQMLWIQAMPGESRQCGGCHSSRAGEVIPRMGATTVAQSVGPDTSTFRPIPDRVELPWAGAASVQNVQDVLDRNCVGCHDGGASDPFAGQTYTVNVTTMEGEMMTFEIPYLDLSSRPISTYYEREVVTYPASYVSLLYPSAMMGDSVATGMVAPEWIVPGDARGSRLVEVMNAVDEAGARAWNDDAHPLHPEDQGVTVSREDRLVLIRAADLGGQYYSRWNVDGAGSWAGTEY